MSLDCQPLRPQPLVASPTPRSPLAPSIVGAPEPRELPPSQRPGPRAEATAANPPVAAPRPLSPPQKSATWKRAALLAGALGMGWWWSGGAAEQDSPAWRHHAEAAREATIAGATTAPLKWVAASGLESVQAQLPIGRGDLIPTPLEYLGANASDRPTSLKLALFDTCDQDGDEVEVRVNGMLVGTVPLRHAPTSLVIPLPAQGPAELTIRGVRDGGGGVTVGCVTSQGEGFFRPLAPGEAHTLRVGGN